MGTYPIWGVNILKNRGFTPKRPFQRGLIPYFTIYFYGQNIPFIHHPDKR